MIAIGSRVPFVLALTLGFTAGAQEPAEKPLSAGEVVLLSNSTDPATAATALKRALSSPDPAARAAAARVITVVPHGSLRGDLVGALVREQDPGTGGEMVRDLLLLSGATVATFIDVQVQRFGAPGAQALAEWLARQQPQEFAKREAELAALAGDRAGELAPIVVMAAQQSSDPHAIYRAWAAVAPPGAWDEALSRSVTIDGVPALLTPVISDALDSIRQPVSEETVWFVLDSTLKKRRISPDLVIKASRPRERVTLWEAFGRELLARGSSSQRGADRRDLVEREGPSHLADIRRLHAAKQLTNQERDAVLAIVPLAKGPPAFDGAILGDQGHTVAAFVPGVIGSTLSAAGCDIRRGGQMALTIVDYASDGRPRHLTIDRTGLSQQCQTALTALARTSLLPASMPSGSGATQRLMIPLDSGFVACADAPPASAAPTPAASLAEIDAPKKTKTCRRFTRTRRGMRISRGRSLSKRRSRHPAAFRASACSGASRISTRQLCNRSPAGSSSQPG
jgi:hypothetical protein